MGASAARGGRGVCVCVCGGGGGDEGRGGGLSRRPPVSAAAQSE